MDVAPRCLTTASNGRAHCHFSARSNVLYHAGERIFKTTDGGMHWEAISDDLTRNDKSKQQISGGPINKDDTGTEYYDTIFAVVESPVAKDEIWAGTDDGLVQLTRDGGKHWANVTPKEIPEWSRISLIEASPAMRAPLTWPSTATRTTTIIRTSSKPPTSALRGRNWSMAF